MGISLPTRPELSLKCKEVSRTQRWNSESRNKNLGSIAPPMTEEERNKVYYEAAKMAAELVGGTTSRPGQGVAAGAISNTRGI